MISVVRAMSSSIRSAGASIQMSAMISKGVDGLITDEPALARRVIDIRAELSTPERIFLMFAENFGLSISEQRYRDNSS